MTTTDPGRLGPQDFDDCFAGEPTPPDATQDLARGRQRRRRGIAGAATATVAVAVAAGLGLALTGPSTQTAVPAAPPSASPSVLVHPSGPPDGSTAPRNASAVPSPGVTMPAGPGPTRPAPSAGPDTAPKLRYSAGKGYLDRDGLTLADQTSANDPFGATTRNTYDLVRLYLDPHGAHLAPDDRDVTGGPSATALQIGQQLPWTVADDPGTGMVQVAVTRLLPGQRPRALGSAGLGFCADPGDGRRCEPETVNGRHVLLGSAADGGFVVDYQQADGEIASARVDPLLPLDGVVPVKQMGVTVAQVVNLLADPALDVVG